MANITVKNAANADVVYNASVPSAGDRSPARWTQNAASAIIGHRPTLEMITRSNGSGNGRLMELNGTFPIVETIGGVPTVTARVPFKLSTTMPTNVDSTLAVDGYTQMSNLAASALVRSCYQEGNAAT
jgi:hypothetical protein